MIERNWIALAQECEPISEALLRNSVFEGGAARTVARENDAARTARLPQSRRDIGGPRLVLGIVKAPDEASKGLISTDAKQLSGYPPLLW